MLEFHVDTCESFLEKFEIEMEYCWYLSKFFGYIKLESKLAENLEDSNYVATNIGSVVMENGIEYLYVPEKIAVSS